MASQFIFKAYCYREFCAKDVQGLALLFVAKFRYGQKADAGDCASGAPKPRESQLVREPPGIRWDKLRSLAPPKAIGAQIVN
jgi:hypothetical protein